MYWTQHYRHKIYLKSSVIYFCLNTGPQLHHIQNWFGIKKKKKKYIYIYIYTLSSYMNITNSLIIFAFSLVINICLTKKDIPYEHALGLFFLD